MADTKISIRKIVCPTDFSDHAASALAESVRLARSFGAKVTVLHVVPFAVPIAGEVGFIPLSVVNDEVARKAKLMEIQRFVDALGHEGAAIETALREGDPCLEIREAVREIGADLIVMGTHGRSGFNRLALGSVTEAILRDPPVPVLTVHRDVAFRTDPFRMIVCATDLSEQTAATIAVAMDLADRGAKRLTFLNVVEHGKESVDGRLQRAAIAALWKLLPDGARGSYRIEDHVAFGEADREILRFAAENGADLVVMGAHRHVRESLFGSTVRGVVRDATCPVLLVPTGYAWPVTEIAKPAEPVGAYRSTKGDRS